MKSGCEHICFIANCGRPLRGPRHNNTLELYFSEINCISPCRYNHGASAAELPLCHSIPLFCCSSLLCCYCCCCCRGGNDEFYSQHPFSWFALNTSEAPATRQSTITVRRPKMRIILQIHTSNISNMCSLLQSYKEYSRIQRRWHIIAWAAEEFQESTSPR